jgi:hypothetical protein
VSSSADGHPVDPAVADASAVHTQLERLLASSHFRNSKRCQALLKHVVEAALEGASDRVKERVIGVDVFGRDPDYDTNQDSVVRNAAIEVRKRLAQYYLEPGHQDQIRIVLPQGGYLPEFHLPAPSTAPLLSPAALAAPPVVVPGLRRWRLAFIIAFPFALLALWLFTRPAPSALDRFWAPLLKDTSPVVLCVGQPSRLYDFIGPRRRELDQKLGIGAPSPPPPEVLEKTPLTLREVNPVGSRYLFFGDTVCLVRVAALLESRSKPFRIRGESSTRYQDLRGNPAVLIGGFDNRWTQRLAASLRFYFVRLPDLNKDELRDRQNPGKAPWVIPGEPRSPDIFEDYAIVSRVLDASTEKTLIAIAGVTQYGTQSAGDFITSPDYLREAFRQAPPGWQGMNMQMVLRTRVVTGAAGPPQVVATHFW